MKLAVPIAQGRLAMHFGHCEQFAVIDIDDTGNVASRSDETPPPHEPGVLPVWLHSLGVTHVIAGGMGARAQNLFMSRGITVIVGASTESPEEIAKAFAVGTLESGDNICDH